MRSICFFIFLLISILGAPTIQAQKQPKSSKTSKQTALPNPKADALQAIKEGKITILTYGHPPEYEYQVLEDSMAALYGFSYVAVADCIVDNAIVNYTKVYNDIISEHLSKKYGTDWEKCLYETIHDLWDEILLRKETAEFLAEQYIALSGTIVFEANQIEVNELGKKLLRTNALGSQRADVHKEVTKSLSYVSLTPIQSDSESAETVNARIENAKKILIETGLDATRIIVKTAADNTLNIKCEKCPGNRPAKKEGIMVAMEWK